MGCNRDSGCYTLAKSTYPKLQSDANGAITAAKNDINSVIQNLQGVYVPGDYLGNKVKVKIDELCKGFDGNISELSTISGGINTFVSGKITEHENHYNDWKRREEEKKKKQEEGNN